MSTATFHSRPRAWRRRGAVVAGALALSAPAVVAAQPVDPYGDGPAGAPAPGGPDPAIDRAVALALVARAEVLLDGGDPTNAKLLAGEALARSSDSQVAPRAHAVIEQAERDLVGLARPRPLGDAAVEVLPPPDAIREPPPGPIDRHQPDPGAEPDGRVALAIYGAAIGGAIGAPLLASFNDEPINAIPGAAGGMALGAAAGYALGRYRHVPYRRARLLGSGGTWGAISVGLLADVVTGTEGTTAGELALGAAVGAGAGAGIAYGLDRLRHWTTGDVALMDAFASELGLAAAAVAVVVAPVEGEGYSLNGSLGAAAGWALGALAGPHLDASTGRVARMELTALAGMAAPWLVYPLIADDGSNDDEQGLAFLSAVGIVTGTFLGYRWTRHLAGEEAREAHRHDGEAPVGMGALVRRSAGGTWSVGAFVPYRRQNGLASGERGGLVVDLAAGRF